MTRVVRYWLIAMVASTCLVIATVLGFGTPPFGSNPEAPTASKLIVITSAGQTSTVIDRCRPNIQLVFHYDLVSSEANFTSVDGYQLVPNGAVNSLDPSNYGAAFNSSDLSWNTAKFSATTANTATTTSDDSFVYYPVTTTGATIVPPANARGTWVAVFGTDPSLPLGPQQLFINCPS